MMGNGDNLCVMCDTCYTLGMCPSVPCVAGVMGHIPISTHIITYLAPPPPELYKLQICPSTIPILLSDGKM